MRAYYAHPRALYGSKQEADDVATIKALGFKCVNPNSDRYQGFSMDQFCDLAEGCDILIYRAFPDGMIGSGMAKEIEIMRCAGKTVLELPGRINDRYLDRVETRQRLRAIKRERLIAYLSGTEDDAYAEQDWGGQ